jgi:DMSO/TMAO reductase YedYZ heme-binding membrane subunit
VSGPLWWYAARAAGIVAWVLLAASVVWGLVLSTRFRPPRVTPAWTLDLHRYLGGLATIFVGVHLAAIMLDSYVSFGLADLLVPLASSWHPVAVAWGVVALYLLLAVELTSLARSRLPRRVWRRVHVLALPLFLLATTHFLAAGSDAANPPALAGIALCSVAVMALVARRVRRLVGSPPAGPARTGSGRGRERPGEGVARAGHDRGERGREQPAGLERRDRVLAGERGAVDQVDVTRDEGRVDLERRVDESQRAERVEVH